MKTVITALVALVIGAGGMYFYQQGSMTQFQSQLTEAKTAAEAAAGEVTKLQEAATAAAAPARCQIQGAAQARYHYGRLARADC